MYDKNLSQADIAKMIGTTQTFVCYLMWGQRKSRAKEKQICEILGLEYKEVV
jgi:cyanate lyase